MMVLQEKSVKGPLHHAIEVEEHTLSGLAESLMKMRFLGGLYSASYEI